MLVGQAGVQIGVYRMEKMMVSTSPKPAKKVIPGPFELPLLGSLHTLFMDGIRIRNQQARDFPDINQINLGPIKLVRVNKAEYVQEVLVGNWADYDKTDQVTGLAQPILGHGLLTSQHKPHRRVRRLVQPAFNHQRVSAYAETMTEVAEARQTIWQDGSTINFTQEMQKITMQVISRVMFSSDVTQEAKELGNAIVTAMAYVTRYFFFPFISYLPVPATLHYRQAQATLNAIIYRMIEERRREPGDQGDFLSMLIQSQDADGSGLDDEQIRDELMTIFIAGHETAANALSWAFYLLARHPRRYERVLAEVDAVLQGRTPTVADLPRLTFTTQVFKETLRLYPPAHFIPRVAVCDTMLDGYAIKKGTLVMVDVFTMQRRPDYFANPNRFEPERFDPEREKAIPKGAYLPFGAGPRVCIGNGFAMLEGQLLLASIAQRVRFELFEGKAVRPEPLVTLRPKGGISMVVRRRT